jgi:outer membrane protein assembly factor BamB
MSFTRFFLALPFFTITLQAAPTEWSQFRGPNRDGVSAEAGLLKDWPADGPRLAWQLKGIGKGMGSVALHAGKLFVLGRREGGQFVTAFDLATQRELWSSRVSDSSDEPQGTPTVDGGQVFAVSKDGRVLACAESDGKELWRKDFAKDFGGRMMSGWGYSESPLVDGEKVIVVPGADDAIMVALERKTGNTIWKAPLPPGIGTHGQPGAGYTGAVVSNAAGIRQYVTLVGRGVIGIAANDGKPLWDYNRVANGTANIPTPLVWDDYVFCSSGYGTGAALLKIVKASGDAKPAPPKNEEKIAELTKKLADLNAEIARRREARAKLSNGTPEYDKANQAVQSIKPEIAKVEQDLHTASGQGDKDEGIAPVPGSPVRAEEQYFLNASTFQNHHGGMVRLGDYIYAGTGHNNGFPICLEWKTGKVIWNKERGPGKESAAVIAADGRLYFRYQDGIMALIAASPTAYEEHGTFKLAHVDGPSWPHPAIQGGKLFLRSQDVLMCYEVSAQQ